MYRASAGVHGTLTKPKPKKLAFFEKNGILVFVKVAPCGKAAFCDKIQKRRVPYVPQHTLRRSGALICLVTL
jgi:hypothetical protein